MAGDIEINIGADASDALAQIERLKDAVAGIAQPVAQVKEAYAGLAEAQQDAAAAAYRSAVETAQAIEKVYASAFDRIGSDIARTLAQAAFAMPRPRTTYSQVLGGNGRTLIEPHQISGAQQLFGGLGEQVATQLGGALEDSLSKSLAQSVFGAGTKSLGDGLAKLLGIGGPGGLLGTGIGAVSGAATGAAATTANTAALAALTTAVGANTAALGVASGAAVSGGAGTAAGGALGAAGGAASLAGAASGGGFLNNALGWIGGLFAFERGGIVPSAAGGWALPNFAGARPALLHAREMVLPAPISEGLQGMIAAGAGSGDVHLHLHNQGPMDGPGVERWFAANKYNIAKALGRIRSFS